MSHGEPGWSEANIQAEFYHHARLINLPVALELSTPVGRIDIAILSKDRSGIVAVIECKRDGRMLSADSRQIRRYKRLGVPVYGLNQWDRAERLARTIAFHHGHSAGVPWAKVKEVVAIPRTGSLDRMAQMADLHAATT